MPPGMNIDLAYGQGSLSIDLPSDRTTVIEPSFASGLPEEKDTLLAALDQPIGLPALRTMIHPDDRICILFTDITRATPNDRIIPWLLEYHTDHPKDHITLINLLGTHRPNTRE